MNKKGGTSLSIGVFVIMILILTMTAFFYLGHRLKTINEDILLSQDLENFFSGKVKLNFYLQTIVDLSARGVGSEQEFIDNFKGHLEFYTFKDGVRMIDVFEEIEKQLVVENIQIVNDDVLITFDISLKGGEGVLNYTHRYEKTFVGRRNVVFDFDALVEGKGGGVDDGNEEIDDGKDIVYDFQGRSVDDILKAMEYAKLNSIVNRQCNCGDNCLEYSQAIVSASEKHQIPDAILLLALMMQESSCRKDTQSDSSFGLMQINPTYWCNQDAGLPSDVESCKNVLLTNYEKNINAGAYILKKNYDAGPANFKGCTFEKTYYSWESALRRYNGLGCNPNYPAQDYFVPQVMERYLKLVELLD